MLCKADSYRPYGQSISLSGYALLPPPLRTLQESLINMMVHMYLFDFHEPHWMERCHIYSETLEGTLQRMLDFLHSNLWGTSSSGTSPSVYLFV